MDLEFDIDILINTFGTDATCKGVPGKVILDAPSAFDNGFAQATAVNKYAATMKASQWSDLRDRDIINIGTKQYIVHSIRYIDDGLVKVVELK